MDGFDSKAIRNTKDSKLEQRLSRKEPSLESIMKKVERNKKKMTFEELYELYDDAIRKTRPGWRGHKANRNVQRICLEMLNKIENEKQKELFIDAVMGNKRRDSIVAFLNFHFKNFENKIAADTLDELRVKLTDANFKKSIPDYRYGPL